MAKKLPDEEPVLMSFPIAFEVVHDFVGTHRKGKRLTVDTFPAVEARRLLRIGAIRIVTQSESDDS